MKTVGHRRARLAHAVAISLCLVPIGSAVASTYCFRVYDGGAKLKYEGRQAPVDLADADSASWTLLRARKEHLLWHPSQRCAGDSQQQAEKAAGRDADPQGNAALILGRIPNFAGRQAN
jgi:hypothetical protein